MHDRGFSSSRRRTLKLAGGGLLLIPVVNVLGCSDSNNTKPAPSTAPQEAPEPSAAPAVQPEPPATPEMPDAAAEAAEVAEVAEVVADAPDSAMARVDEAGSSAQALGYRHDATTVDRAKYGKYQDGQQCANCVLFMADAAPDAGLGGCSIFPGQLVSSSGWCNVYQPKPA